MESGVKATTPLIASQAHSLSPDTHLTLNSIRRQWRGITCKASKARAVSSSVKITLPCPTLLPVG